MICGQQFRPQRGVLRGGIHIGVFAITVLVGEHDLRYAMSVGLVRFAFVGLCYRGPHRCEHRYVFSVCHTLLYYRIGILSTFLVLPVTAHIAQSGSHLTVVKTPGGVYVLSR